MPDISLKVQGLGHVPSMKNNKMLTRGRLITNPKRQQWMEKCSRSLELQLLSWSRTTAAAMQMVHSPHSLICSALPADDSVREVTELHVFVKRVLKGQEGAEIMIERI